MASPTTTAKKLRILCLHGHRHNPALMELHVAPLRRALGDAAELVFVNGVSPARGEPDALVRRQHLDKAPFYEWYDVRRLDEHEDQNAEWFFQYDGLDDALLYMDEQLQRLGPFDAVLGFSQGAVLMTILSMYFEHKNRALQGSDSAPPWWKLCISVCTWCVRDYSWKFLFEGSAGETLLVPLPSIHLAGKKDPLHYESDELMYQFAGDNEGSAGEIKKLFIEFVECH